MIERHILGGNLEELVVLHLSLASFSHLVNVCDRMDVVSKKPLFFLGQRFQLGTKGSRDVGEAARMDYQSVLGI